MVLQLKALKTDVDFESGYLCDWLPRKPNGNWLCQEENIFHWYAHLFSHCLTWFVCQKCCSYLFFFFSSLEGQWLLENWSLILDLVFKVLETGIMWFNIKTLFVCEPLEKKTCWHLRKKVFSKSPRHVYNPPERFYSKEKNSKLSSKDKCTFFLGGGAKSLQRLWSSERSIKENVFCINSSLQL